MNKILTFIFCALSCLSAFGQNPKAIWSDNIWANAFSSVPGNNINQTSFKTVMCPDGGFYATFSYFDSVKVGGKIFNSKGGEDLMIVRYSKNKTVLWTYNMHNPKRSKLYIENVFLGEDNSFYASLEYDSAITLGADTTVIAVPLSTMNKTNAIIVKIDITGKLQWVQDFQTTLLLMGRSFPEGCLVTNMSGNDIKWNGKVYHRGGPLHFNKSGTMDYNIDSVGQYYLDITNNQDTDLFIHGSVSKNAYSVIGTDTIRSNNEGEVEYSTCVAKKGRKTKWTYTVKNKGLVTPGTQDHLMALDKYGNSYYCDVYGGDSVKVENTWHYFYPSGIYAGMLQLDKNGKYKNFLCDSMPVAGAMQAMRIAISSDSTKLILVFYSNRDFWFPGIGNLLSGNWVFLLDITQNLKCTRYFRINTNSYYAYNPWDLATFANSVGLVYVTNYITDTINTYNTGKNNVAIVYYSDKAQNGISKAAENSHFIIYPNPGKDWIYVSGEEISEIRIIDITGHEFNLPPYIHGAINISNLESGTYILQLNKIYSYKFVKE